MNKKWARFAPSVAALFAAAIPAGAVHKVVNDSDKPLMAVQLTDVKGTPTAKLYIVPKGEMVFGDDGWPASGAGYIESLPGRTFYVPCTWLGTDGNVRLGGFRVEKIEWDRTGRLVAVTGLRQEFEARPNMEISSDTSKPKIVDGLLHLKFKEKGETEYKIKTSFGKGVSIQPDGL